jgi:hypothetical protein
MTLAQFLKLLDRHGPDPVAWPAHQREAALTLSTASPDAAAALGTAQRLDRILREGAIAVDDASVGRVMARVPAMTRQTRSSLKVALWNWGLMPLWPRVGFLAATLALGIFAGAKFDDAPIARPAAETRLSALIYGGDPLQDLAR